MLLLLRCREIIVIIVIQFKKEFNLLYLPWVISIFVYISSVFWSKFIFYLWASKTIWLQDPYHETLFLMAISLAAWLSVQTDITYFFLQIRTIPYMYNSFPLDQLNVTKEFASVCFFRLLDYSKNIKIHYKNRMERNKNVFLKSSRCFSMRYLIHMQSQIFVCWMQLCWQNRQHSYVDQRNTQDQIHFSISCQHNDTVSFTILGNLCNLSIPRAFIWCVL